jgi:hypothetical protein
LLSIRLNQIKDDPAFQPWSLRAIVLREDRVMVGHIGFQSMPAPDYLRPYSPDAVEFGFTVYPAHRCQGFAREASIALRGSGRFAHHSEQNLITAIESGVNLLSSPDAGRAVNMHLAIVRQAERLLNVEARLAELRQAATNAPTARGLSMASAQLRRRKGDDKAIPSLPSSAAH